MNRREFIGSGVVLAARPTSGTGWSSEPWPPSLNQLLEPINLRERIRLGQNALLGGLDPTQNHLPYWSCRYDPKVGFSPHHSGCRDHDVGRALHGLSMAEEVTGWRIAETVIRDLAEFQFGLFEPGDGLPGTTDDATGKWTANLHNVRESINGLTALIKWGNITAAQVAQNLVWTLRRALDDTGKLHRERLPNYVRKSDDQPSQEGRSVDALVRYYRVTADPIALETATLITSFALENCFAPDGTLAALAGGHGHSINALVAGMLDLAMLTNDQKMLERARRVFDVGLPFFNTRFGWSLETVPRTDAPVELPLRGEANNTGDLLRATLILGRAGFPEYFGRAELILRGHLLPSQLVNVTGFSDDPQATDDHLRSLGSRAKGGLQLSHSQ